MLMMMSKVLIEKEAGILIRYLLVSGFERHHTESVRGICEGGRWRIWWWWWMMMMMVRILSSFSWKKEEGNHLFPKGPG